MKLSVDFSELLQFGNNLQDSKLLDFYCKKATKEMSKILLEMVFDKTPVKTGKLAEGWLSGKNLAYNVVEVKDGFEVTFANDVEYATWVNDGHRVRNQEQGPYLEVKRRTVPYYDGNSSNYFVYGHFFVEKSIVTLVDGGHALDNAVYKEMNKWFGRCVNGK